MNVVKVPIVLLMAVTFGDAEKPVRLREEQIHFRNGKVERNLQVDYFQGDICPSMNNALVPPDNSNCWQWWTPPPDGILAANAPLPPTGCDYQPCQDAVCSCDPYCCEQAWDESCRGYKYSETGKQIENNYFVQGCSAAILCCEPESAFPDAIPSDLNEPAAPGPSAPATSCTESNYAQGDLCSCMNNAFVPPDSSNCWQWYTPPPDGILSANDPTPPKGCDYQPCQDAVCSCDPYCCEQAWDESCRGYKFTATGEIENNFFVQGCSAAILCCEPQSAFPDILPASALAPAEPQLPSEPKLEIKIQGYSTKYSEGKKGSKGSKGSKGGKGSKGSETYYNMFLH